MENRLRDLLRECFSEFESVANIWRGWIVPVGGSTPDRLKGRPAFLDPHSPTGSRADRRSPTGSPTQIIFRRPRNEKIAESPNLCIIIPF